MASAITSVIIASAQSVAKVFVIGGVGWATVLYPRKAPFLPRHLVGSVARFTFHALLIPLIYSTIATAVTLDSVGDYWFVIVGGFVVLGMSYLVATVVRLCIPIANLRDFYALRIAATFPNIVALPILIFPSLCEFAVVHEGYATARSDNNDDSIPLDSSQLQRQCEAQANTMIFIYFFTWSLAFWSFGHPQLIHAAKMKTDDNTKNKDNKNDKINQRQGEDELEISATAKLEEGTSTFHETSQSKPDEENEDKIREKDGTVNISTRSDPPVKMNPKDVADACLSNDNPSAQQEESQLQQQQQQDDDEPEQSPSVFRNICTAMKQTMTSPGFIALALAFITACIPPLQHALFQPGAPLRFLGSALESLGVASSPISTMVVAASLVPPPSDDGDNNQEEEDNGQGGDDSPIVDENPAMTDPNFGPYRRRQRQHPSSSDSAGHGSRRRLQEFRRSMHKSSRRILKAIPRSSPEMRRLHVWFCLSRLIITPAVIVGLIVAADCGTNWLQNVPNLAKLVIIINSSIPGALIVVVILKSNEALAETAAAVAKVYLPSYLLSIITIAAWTAVGLWLTLPDDDGNTFCQRL